MSSKRTQAAPPSPPPNPPPSRGRANRIALAAVAGAHGIKGDLKLKLFSASTETVAGQSTVFVGGREYRLTEVKASGKGAIASLEGVNDRSAAESLRGQLIEVDRSALPPLDNGEYYHADLIGLECVDRDGESVGTVVAVENYGAGDLLEVQTDGGKRSLIPFKAGIADLEGGAIVLDREFLA